MLYSLTRVTIPSIPWDPFFIFNIVNQHSLVDQTQASLCNLTSRFNPFGQLASKSNQGHLLHPQTHARQSFSLSNELPQFLVHTACSANQAMTIKLMAEHSSFTSAPNRKKIYIGGYVWKSTEKLF